MPYTYKFELARQKMLEADRALNDYLRNCFYSPEQEKRLADSVKAARDEFVDSVASLFPDISRRSADPVPLDPGQKQR